jgi:hypothetical protein
MHLSSNPVVTAMTVVVLSLPTLSCNASPAEIAGNGAQIVACEKNPYVTPTLQVCAFQGEDVRYYLIDTQDGRHIRLAFADGAVTVLQAGEEMVLVAPSPTVARTLGITAVVYRDADVEIESVQGAQRRLMWLVVPQINKLPAAQFFCAGSFCSGGGIQIK